MEDCQNNEYLVATQHVENIVEIDNGSMFTTSLIVAQAFEKEHKDVLKAISNLECSKEFHERNFAPMVYEAEIGSGAKRDFPAYRLTRDGFAFLAMGFTGKKDAKGVCAVLSIPTTSTHRLPTTRPVDTKRAGSAINTPCSWGTSPAT